MASPQTTQSVLAQLEQARQIVLKTPHVYHQIVPGVLGVVGPASHLDLRRWGAAFLAETFASPVLPTEQKQSMSLLVLDTLKGWLSRQEERGEEEDGQVVKSVVQCAASIYPYVFRHTVHHVQDETSWAKMAGIKSAILRRMDSAGAGVRICCVKFVARVVQTQTPGVIAVSDPRRPEQNEISLALVPREHPVMPPSNLEAEASGLLDRLLGVLQENLTDALLVTATLNALATLVQKRASVSNKILTTILNFNPLKLAGGRMTGRDRVAVRSMARTTISFLLSVLKRNPQHQLAGRLQQRTEQLRYSLNEAFTEGRDGKRKEPDEPTDGLDDAKRRRVEPPPVQSQQQAQPTYPPLSPGPVTVAQLFTLSRDPSASSIHAAIIPEHFVAQLIPPLLQSIDPQKFEAALNAVRARFLDLARNQPPPSALDAARTATGQDDDDDYDPSAAFPGQAQVLDRLDRLAPEGSGDDVEDAVGLLDLPPPPPLSEAETREYCEVAEMRLFGTLKELDDQRAKASGKKASSEGEKGFNRLLAIGGQDREGWVSLITRLATRSPFMLGEESEEDSTARLKSENGGGGEDALALKKRASKSDRYLADRIRAALKDYITTDFRRRIDVGIAWLSEEWYADRLALQSQKAPTTRPTNNYLPNYTPHSLALLTALLPYLDTKDGRFLIRLLSEIPALSAEHIALVTKLAEDPERVGIAVQALMYLVMVRPPIRNVCLDALEGLWRQGGDAKVGAGKVLARWRPEVLKEGTGDAEGGKVEG
ncbi:hypothetical protein B0A50_01882 [Salinomyces thailandicus]|uniref:Symplekin/Pta1 N-terminal domain-containing protein n=1 Tax=Salinomyces thailandicus TaxID=706561 RepID=A0A4U0U8Z8_9PEZI|nr:hypothetical protein B0A50_01882 [Salinomyces thailandica]